LLFHNDEQNGLEATLRGSGTIERSLVEGTTRGEAQGGAVASSPLPYRTVATAVPSRGSSSARPVSAWRQLPRARSTAGPLRAHFTDPLAGST